LHFCTEGVLYTATLYGSTLSCYLLTEGYLTGIRKSSEEYKISEKSDVSTNILLRISSCWSEVKISMLSDEDFDEVIHNAF
jgi:hypothetical protein